MYARISALEGSQEHIDEGLREVRENACPNSKNRTGSQGWLSLPPERRARS